MEPESEPDRCRRTDGRKWRCREIVVPNQKYCERHMHRGRGRSSRKRVERDSQSASEPDNSSSIASEYGDRKKRDNHQVKEGEERGLQNSDPKKINHQSEEKANHPKFISPGFGSSPKSVLCHSAGNVELSLDPKNPKKVTESIPERCRRTDGKKWQCSQYALPSQKYCHSHMHRGNKVLEGCSSSILPRSLENSINLNVIPKSTQHIDGNSASDATTNSRFSLAKSLINC